MIASLIFDFDDENRDDKEEYEMCMNGKKYHSVLWDFDQELRKKLKYEELDEKEYDIYDNIRTMLWDLLDEEGLNL